MISPVPESTAIAAAVVTFDAPERLAACLQQMAMQTLRPSVVFVVNNGSPSIARRVVADAHREFPELAIELLQSPVNSGPAGGHYMGMQHALEAGFDRLWVMDDDITPHANCLAALAASCPVGTAPVIAWPEQTNPGGEVQNYPGWYGFLINRAAIDVGGLPDRRLVWWIEDTEYLFHRLPRRGVKAERVAGASVMHGEGRPEREKPPWKIFYETRNTLWYRVHEQRLARKRQLLRSLGSLARSAVRSSTRGEAIRAFVAGSLDGARGNLGHRWPLPAQRVDQGTDTAATSRLAAFVMTYHREDRCLEHVEALLSQSLPPARVIVVDNGRSSVLASALERHGNRVEYLKMPWNTGPAGASSAGLMELVRDSEWIYWGDDDQPPAVGAFATLLDLAEAEGADAIAARGWRWSEQAGALRRAEASGNGVTHVQLDTAAGSMTLLIRSSAVRAIGLPISELFWGYEDVEYLLRLRRAGLRLVAPPRAPRDPRTVERSEQLEFDALPRRYYTVRNSVFMTAHMHGHRLAAVRVSARAVGASATTHSKGLRYGLRSHRLTWAALCDGWLGRLGAPIPLRSTDLRRNLLEPEQPTHA